MDDRSPSMISKRDHRRRRNLRRAVSVAAVLCVVIAICVAPLDGQTALAQSAWYEGFEGPEASWVRLGAVAQSQGEYHGRIQGQARTGDGCERLRLALPQGAYTHLAHDVGHPRVIDELKPSVQVKSSRAGIQLLARIALPRTIDPKTGKPLTVLVPGTIYTSIGRWQQLHVKNVPHLLRRQTQLKRYELRTPVDDREAYVESVVLEIHNGSGLTDVWIDDLEVAGYVGAAVPEEQVARPEQASPRPSYPDTASASNAAGPGRGPIVRRQQPPPARVRWDLSVLVVDGRPIFPRIIQYQGEPLQWLKRLGFNTVWLPSFPSGEILQEAEQAEVWLVCPAPTPGRAPDGSALPLPEIGPQYDRVLAWDLGRFLRSVDLPRVRDWAEQIRAADRRGRRPLVCMPSESLQAYSPPLADFLVIGRSPLSGTLELADYGRWLRRRPQLAKPGTSVWTTVQTEPAATVLEQWDMLSGGAPRPISVSSEQIRLLTYTSLTAGSRALVFESRSRLNGTDPDTQYRAKALELLNLELMLIEPWITTGRFVQTVEGSEPGLIGAVLRSDRAQLLIPLWSVSGAQCVSGESAGERISFVVPGVPTSNNAYLLTAGGLQPILNKARVTGGTRVTLDDFGLTSLIFFTEDTAELNNVTLRTRAVGPRAAELRRQLADARLRAVEQTSRLLPRVHAASAGGSSPGLLSTEQLNEVRRSLQWCDGYLAHRNYADAYLQAERALRPLRRFERRQWEAAVSQAGSIVGTPASGAFWSLPYHWELSNRVSRGRLGPNQLPGGDFEDPTVWRESGWSYYQHSSSEIFAEANLGKQSAHNGAFGLRLAARAARPDDSPNAIELPPVVITSAPVSVEAGSVVGIFGWIRVPEPITGSVDGLMVSDSITGEALAERIHHTPDWQPLALYRVVPRSGQLTIRFELTGLGEAWIDDIAVRVLGAGESWASAAERSAVR